MNHTDDILDMLQDSKDMLLYLGLAILGVALIALFRGLFAVCGLIICIIGLTQTKNGVTATIEYLIVDQKQVNVFFRLYSDIYPDLNVEPEVRQADGSHAQCGYGLNAWDVPNGELQSVTIDFVDEDVPEQLRLGLDISIPMHAREDFAEK